MTPVIPCSVNNISLIPGAADFNVRKFRCLTKCGSSRRTTKYASTSQRFGAPLRLFPQQYQKGLPLIKKYGAHIISATETDVAVEEADSPVADEASAEASEVQSDAIKVESEAAPAQSKRTRAPRKSAMPPVKNEELIVGATFTGKVTSIQPFGAFVDIGAFKDGLVHVSRLSDKFVKDVGTIVSVGQEVKVKLVEADTETGRISLDMRDDDANKTNQKTDGPVATTDRPRSARRDAPRSSQRKDDVKSSKLVKGQELEGRVKNLTRSGAFISLPDGEEGFLPQSEEPLYEGIGNTSLQPDQEVKVRVLRVNRGKVTLTQKAETKDNTDLNFTGEEYAAVNPFVLAFRKNKDIAAFLDQRGKVEKEVEAVEKVEAFSEESETETDVANTEVVSILIDSQETEEAPPSVDVVQSVETSGSSGEIAEQVSVSENSVSDNVQIPIAEVSIPSAAPVEGIVDVSIPSAAPVEGIAEVSIPSAAPVEDASEPEIGILAASEEPEPQLTNSNGSTPQENVTEVLETAGAISPALVKQLREETGAGMMDCKKALAETAGDIVKAQEFLRKKGLASADKKASRVTAEGRIGSYIHDSRIGVLVEVNCETDFVSRGDIFKELVEDLAMQVAASPQVQYLATEDVPEEIINKEKEIEMQKEDLASKPEQIRAKMVEGRIRKRLEELALLEQPYIKNDKLVVKDMVKQTIATIGENIKVKRFVRYNLGEGLEKKSQDFAAEVAAQTTAKAVSAPEKVQSAPVEAEATIPKPPAAAVPAALVKQLREETGAGMMDCKKALSETGGDLEKAQEYLRVKGLSTADKKSSRLAAEGRIGAYIHDSRIGVLIEVNCETDFVGRSEKFKELVDDLAMQVVACPQVQFVSMDEISPDVINKEKEIEMQREDLAGKPENIREKIVEGRVSKRLGELALLEQPFIKEDSILIKDLVKQTVAALGENIKVRRFVRFTLGETKDDVKTETATEG